MVQIAPKSPKSASQVKPMAEPSRISRINEIAERETAMFMAEEAFGFLDCAIRLCAHSVTIKSLIARLRSEADMLEEFE
jgi:hypothetical protein